MKILYITPLVAGFEDILRGKMESRGLPSFIFPLQELIRKGHMVDIILISNYKDPINIKVEWIKSKNIIANINNDLVDGNKAVRIVNKIKSLLELSKTINKLLKEKRYDFVYCHGKAGLLGNLYANKYKVRCGYRIYGTIGLARNIREKGIINTAISYPVYFAIFNIKKDFMIITDDGTEGDFVYDKLALEKKFKLFFWLNGIEKTISYSKCEISPPEGKYLFHAARICRVKAQHKNIELLYRLHKKGVYIKLYFAGHIEDDGYKKELDLLIQNCNLNEYVVFCGDINRADLENLATKSVAVPLFADFNQGNVFLECMMAGSIIVTFYEKMMGRFILDGENGFFVKDIDDAAEKIKILCEMPEEKIVGIKLKAKNWMEQKLLSWDERVGKEIKLIEMIGERQ